MYFFDRKTMYFVWYREDGQARGVGSVQLTAVENVCRIEVSVTNCGRVDGEFPCYLLSGPVESLLGMIRLEKGRGTLSVRSEADRIGHKQVPYGKLTGIHIDLKADGYLEQKWLPTGPCTEVRTEKIAVVEEPAQKKTEEKRQEPKPVQLYTDKWQQLCAIYPIVHPFGDARGYLSIEPRDFVILQERYQTMVQNSFLLHGFYNYRYLLLGRRRGERGMEYYLGVPGILYEKERAAALFYGFEAFEGVSVPAKDGDFGYYMKRVQI